MASLQQKTVNGYKYWYIVESRRVNGKPTPIVLKYLGTAESLLKKLDRQNQELQLKSYSHGDVAALLQIAHKLDIPWIINKYIKSPRPYFSEKPIRNNITAGATYLLGAIGRTCMVTSKKGWYDWAKTTSLEYLLKTKFNKLDSQHFWDLMDALPEENIYKVEEEILKKVKGTYNLQCSTLFYDTTNFYTYIATTNEKCSIAARGKNKQKRTDLRQVGMALVVSQDDHVPLFHQSYQGNLNDTTIFKSLIKDMALRIGNLKMDINNHTFVFDRGNNSKNNLAIVNDLKLFYVGALSPCHHKELVAGALGNTVPVEFNGGQLDVYRTKTKIWDIERTIVVFISENLKSGQVRGVYQVLGKKEKKLKELQSKLSKANPKKRNRGQIIGQIKNILNTKQVNELISWELKWLSRGKYELKYSINANKIEELESKFGIRVIMTNRHDWGTVRIIKSYYGQSDVEKAFKEMKNPYHLSIKPQYHWTDQKIKIHNFICVMGFLLTSLVWMEARQKLNYQGSINTLFNTLKNIRLGSILSKNEKNGRIKAEYKIEEMTSDEKEIFEHFNLMDFHINKPVIQGFSIYQ